VEDAGDISLKYPQGGGLIAPDAPRKKPVVKKMVAFRRPTNSVAVIEKFIKRREIWAASTTGEGSFPEKRDVQKRFLFPWRRRRRQLSWRRIGGLPGSPVVARHHLKASTGRAVEMIY